MNVKRITLAEIDGRFGPGQFRPRRRSLDCLRQMPLPFQASAHFGCPRHFMDCRISSNISASRLPNHFAVHS